MERFHLGEFFGPVDLGLSMAKQHNSLNIGAGIFAGSIFPGSNRLIINGFSQSWGNFYISSMGGAALVFDNLGINMVCIRGRASSPSILYLNRTHGEEIEVDIVPVNIWKIWENGRGGIYSLIDYVLERFGGSYGTDPRVLAVGPAAETTDMGAIASVPMKNGKATFVDTWAGRGGFGTKMLREHGIAAVIYGGTYIDEDFRDRKVADEWFTQKYNLKLATKDMEATTKYRFDPDFGTGGTFGSNYHAMGEKLMSFNYRSVFEPKAARLRQQQAFIVDHYLKQFNEETIAKKQFEHCGEPCSVACKKMNGHYKKDYEPYHTLGPQLGVFDQRAAELLNDHADAMGFDAIQIGGTLAWIMECVATGRIPPEDYGLPPKHQLRFEKFTADPQDFDLVEDSMKNARYAMATIDAILNDPRAAVFRHGIRAAARTLDQRHPDTRPGQCAVYLAHGENGSMVPNQYFVPGMGSPMPIMGKYYVYYGPELLAPDELGRRNVERMVYELICDNTGLCRFHRQWGETMAGKLAWERFGLDIDYFRHHFELARQIHASEDGKSMPWETERMAGMFFHYLRWQVESGKSLAQLAPCLEAAGEIGLSLEQITAAATLPADHAALKKVAHVFWEAIRAGQRAAFIAYTRAFSGGLPEKYSSYYTDDVKLSLPSVSPMNGKQAIVDFYTRMFRTVREDLVINQIVYDDSAIVGDFVSVFTAVEDAPDFVVKPLQKGESVRVPVFVYYTLKGGLISEIRVARQNPQAR
jgi:glyceraldehyde-3-phosphate dehydrogenase (ferredoxin)